MKIAQGTYGIPSKEQLYTHNMVAEREEKQKEVWSLLKEITEMAENFPNLGKEIDIQTQDPQIVLNKKNLKRPTPRYITIKMSKATRCFMLASCNHKAKYI